VSRRPASTLKPSRSEQKDQRREAARRRRRRRLLLQVGGVGVAVVGLLFLVSRAGGGNGSSRPPSGQPGAGQPAPPIQLTSTSGSTFDLSAERGKTVLLYFQEGVGCQPCWNQIRDLQPRVGELHSLGIDEFVTIAGNPVDQLRQKASDEKITIPVLADPDLSLGSSYHANQYGMMGTSAYGHTFIVVGPDGTIRWRGDFGGAPHYTMYVSPATLLADLRTGLTNAKP